MTTADSGLSKKQLRQAAAERREKIRPLKRALEKTEKHIDALNTQLDDLQVTLADTGLYDDSRKVELAELLKTEGELKLQRETLEGTWLEQQESIDALEGD